MPTILIPTPLNPTRMPTTLNPTQMPTTLNPTRMPTTLNPTQMPTFVLLSLDVGSTYKMSDNIFLSIKHLFSSSFG
jgi:hypothetical protein